MEYSTELRANLDERLANPRQILSWSSDCPETFWTRECNRPILVIHQNIQLSNGIPPYDPIDMQAFPWNSLSCASKPHERGVDHYCGSVGKDDRTELHPFHTRWPDRCLSRKRSDCQGIRRQYRNVGLCCDVEAQHGDARSCIHPELELLSIYLHSDGWSSHNANP